MAEPISFSFEPTGTGAHTRVVVRAGVDGSRALCGELVMRTHEWHLLRWLLATTPPLNPEPDLKYVPAFAREYTEKHQHRLIPIDDTPVVCQPERMAQVIGDRLEAAVRAVNSSSVPDARVDKAPSASPVPSATSSPSP